MIVTCPECATRYRVADDAIDPSQGRRVRCAQCGHLWLYRPEPPADMPPPDLPTGEPPPLRAVPPMLPAETSGSRRGHGRVTTLLAALVLLAAALAGGYAERDRIAAVWPAAARLWEALGFGGSAKPAPPPSNPAG